MMDLSAGRLGRGCYSAPVAVLAGAALPAGCRAGKGKTLGTWGTPDV